jgi:hypothetical protein
LLFLLNSAQDFVAIIAIYRTRLKTGAMERKTIAPSFGALSFSPYRPMEILHAVTPLTPLRRHTLTASCPT